MIDTIAIDNFMEFGSVYYQPVDIEAQPFYRLRLLTHARSVRELFRLPCEACIEVTSGIAAIVLGTQPDTEHLQVFPIHQHLRLKPGVYFNVLALSDRVAYDLLAPESRLVRAQLTMPFVPQPAPEQPQVSKVLDSCYLDAGSAHCFQKALHSYYELLYVNSGTLQVAHAGATFSLTSGEVLLCAPDSKRAKLLAKNAECAYLSVIFDMQPTESHELLNRAFFCTNGLREALQKLIEDCTIPSAYANTLIMCRLQEVVVRLVQLCDRLRSEGILDVGASTNCQNELLQHIVHYMNARVTEPISIEEICRKFFISRSSLQALFKLYLHTSPKSYLIDIKLQKSKDLILENQHTISEIADMLGFSSIHYFSRLFKKYFDVSPSQYAKTLAESENA